MLFEVRRTVSLALSWLLVLTPALAAQQTNSTAAPVPQQVLNARKVFVSNGGGSNYYIHLISDGPNRAYNTFYRELKRTKRYELVNSPAQADLIFEIRAIAPAESYNDTVYHNSQVVLTIRDPETSAVLWRERANVRFLGTKKQRDRQFDRAVAVLVDKLAMVTGQPLTQAQTRAIARNSRRFSNAAIVVTVVGIAALVGMTAWGIHRVNNPPKLNPPPPPTPGLP